MKTLLTLFREGIAASDNDADTDTEDSEASLEVIGNTDIAGTGSDARGFAWMQMDRSGLIKYHLKWNDLSSDLVSIQIDNGYVSSFSEPVL